ncbi:response regulator [Microbulbifer sp. THAF38]|uniref:response regulator n=1 Tax=Microbulbifer sp. THAF38 TaxID=2587856 RepID=UPI0012692C7A|nr:response regulator [Microbulbifer sp. THAF38]QFT55992.1 Response regulator rcp1 [Microbulbifer sp. THAF38]
MQAAKSISIILADDDKDDQLLTREALEESLVKSELSIVDDGVELLSFLKREGEYEHLSNEPLPDLILLDLNMPRMDGRQALAAIKADPDFRRIPVVILTTSKAEEDMFKSYDLGAASYLSKPVTFEGLVDLMRSLGRYWVEFVEFPGKQRSYQ